MRAQSGQERGASSRTAKRRTGLASFLFAIVRPGDARAVSVSADRVHLTFGSRSINVALGDFEGTELRAGRRWSAVRLRHSGGRATVSGLARNDERAAVGA